MNGCYTQKNVSKMPQTRALRTRDRALKAGAFEFAQHGYSGTTLTDIARTAGITLGALTFHFATKRALAEAVCLHGRRVTEDETNRVITSSSPALQVIIDITYILIRLLREDDSVRALNRLGRERITSNWHDSWLPHVHALSERAGAEGKISPTSDPLTLTMFATGIVSVVETSILDVACSQTNTPSSVQVEQMWETILRAILPKEVKELPQPGLSRF
ncbi:TetR/AcrR family transcriptional regulator [Actinopolyspora lacussalsi]|nr:TetR/AcrR family transcriptional regulator [Actinopolyspora righensis]